MKNTFHSNVIIVQSDLKKVTDLSNPIDPFNEFKDLVGSTGANILKEYHGQQNSLFLNLRSYTVLDLECTLR